MSDNILSVDGQMLTESDRFNTYVAARPTSSMSVIVLRDGLQETVIVNPAASATIRSGGDSRSASTTSGSTTRPASAAKHRRAGAG